MPPALVAAGFGIEIVTGDTCDNHHKGHGKNDETDHYSDNDRCRNFDHQLAS